MKGLVTLLLFPAVWLLQAFALVQLWAWFVTPFGAPALQVPQTFGLLLIYRLLAPCGPEPKGTPDEIIDAALGKIWASALGTLFVLGLGYCATFFL